MAYIVSYFFHELSTSVYMSWIIYFKWRFEWEITQVGIYISVVGITVGFFQGVLLHPITRMMKVGRSEERRTGGATDGSCEETTVYCYSTIINNLPLVASLIVEAAPLYV